MIMWIWIVCGFIATLIGNYLLDNTEDEQILEEIKEHGKASVLMLTMLLGPLGLPLILIDLLKKLLETHSDETDDNN